MQTETYREAKSLIVTTFERGKIAGETQALLLQLETRFGTLSEDVRTRVEAMTPEQVRDALVGIVRGQSLQELGFDADRPSPEAS